ncbi:MAG: hypothetical protein K9L56_10120 [Clostridiales bacterium]|nr:hypothetical protein [Clostridiales bacterium]
MISFLVFIVAALGTVVIAFKRNPALHKTRVIWAGYYIDEGFYLEEFSDVSPDINLHKYAKRYFTKIEKIHRHPTKLLYIVNHSTKECFDMQDRIEARKKRPGAYHSPTTFISNF